MPELLAEDLINAYSNPGDLVFDPMVGSGTVVKLAKLMGRNFLGCEIASEYMPIIEQRLLSKTRVKRNLISSLNINSLNKISISMKGK